MFRKVGVFIVGWAIVIAGLVMLVTPGPGWVAIFAGLSLLATEFAWAARLKDWVQKKLADWVHRVQVRRAARKRRRSGIVDETVDDVLSDAQIVAANADDDSLITMKSLAAPRRRQRKDGDEFKAS